MAFQHQERLYVVCTSNGAPYAIGCETGHSWKHIRIDHIQKVVCNQWHNIPNRLLHGSYEKHCKAIERQGFRRGGEWGSRSVIMFSPTLPDDGGLAAGMRKDIEVIYAFDVVEMMKNFVFW